MSDNAINTICLTVMICAYFVYQAYSDRRK